MANNELKHITRELINEFMEYEALLIHDCKMSADNYWEIKEELLFRLSHYKPVAGDNALFTADGKMGVRNNVLGSVLIPPVYDDIPYAVPRGYYSVAVNDNKYGIVKADGKGTVIVPFDYELVYELGDGCYLGAFCVMKGGRQGIVSVCRDIARVEVEPDCDLVEHIPQTEFTLLKKEGKYGLWSYGCYVAPEYDEVFVPEVLGWVMVKKCGKWGYIDCNNEFTDDINLAYLYNQN